MANIQPYQSPDISLRPTEEGINTIAGNARRVGAFYNQGAGALESLASSVKNAFGSIGRALGSGIAVAGEEGVNIQTHDQISHGSAVASDMFVNLEKQWNDTVKNADPNDKSVAAKFKEQVLQPQLDKFAENFTTEKSQQFADGIINRYRQHFDTKTAADMSSMAGIAAKQNAQKTINSLSSAVYLDPSSLDTAIDSLKHSAEHIVGSSPTIDAETGARVTAELNQKGIESLVKSAVTGMIAKNPNVDLDAIQKKYGDYINGGELKMFQKQAQTEARKNALVEKQTLETNRRLADQAVHEDTTKLITDTIKIDPQTNQPTIDPSFFKGALDIARKHPDAPNAAETVRTLLNWGEAQQNKERKIVTDQATASSLDSRMFTDDPTSKMDILKAEAAGKLTRADAEIRTKIIDQRDKVPADPQFKFAMDGAKELIEGRTAGERSMQSGKYAAFMQEFLQEYQRQKAAGTLPPNALSLRDPNSLLSKSMEAYKSPLAAAIGGNGGVKPPPPPAASAAAPEPPKYQPGDVVNTSEGPRRFKGGNYRDKANWEPVS